MTNFITVAFDEKDKIAILLHEYDTLRNEIIQRTGNGFQLTGIGIAILGLLLTQSRGALFWLVLVGGLLVISTGTWFNFRDISKAAERVRELEADINARAGEELLKWESKWGSATVGWLWRARPLK